MRPAFTLFAVLGLGCACEGTLAPPDATFDAPGLDAAIDAYTPPPFEPTLMWRAEGAGMCPVIMTPVWDPPNELAIARGEQRWSVARPPVYSDVAPPTLLGDGTSYWGIDLSVEGRLDYVTGDFERFGLRVGTPIPLEMRDTEFRYRLPRMTLGRDTIVIRDLWSLRRLQPGGGFRAWTFPYLDDLFAYARTQPLPWPPSNLEQTMPAWNPVTGQIAFTAGIDNGLLAVQCPGDDMGQFVLDIGPREPPPTGAIPSTQIYYRENGELILYRNARMHVVSPIGEVLRSETFLPTARPLAYDRTCGVLMEVNADLGQWGWWDVDAMALRTTLLLDNPQRYPGAVAGTEECGVFYGGRVAHPDGTETVLPSLSSFAIPLRGDRWVSLDAFLPRLQIVDSRGAILETISTSEVRAAGIITPDGNVITRTTRWYLGYAPGLPLHLNSGLNWAHTNSPLPE